MSALFGPKHFQMIYMLLSSVAGLRIYLVVKSILIVMTDDLICKSTITDLHKVILTGNFGTSVKVEKEHILYFTLTETPSKGD